MRLRQEANFRRVLGVLFEDISLDTQLPGDFWPIGLPSTSFAKRTISGLADSPPWCSRSMRPNVGMEAGLLASVDFTEAS